MKVLEVEHRNKNGTLLRRIENVKNILHLNGEQFLLTAVFAGMDAHGVNQVTPQNYYLGLDNRSEPATEDTLAALVGEPVAYTGYARQAVNSTTGFTVGLDNGHWVALSTVVSFQASGGAWGPVKNLFLTNREDNGGYLISTASLATSENAISVNDGDFITMRLTMSLQDC